VSTASSPNGRSRKAEHSQGGQFAGPFGQGDAGDVVDHADGDDGGESDIE
jgi:hypothetical protein